MGSKEIKCIMVCELLALTKEGLETYMARYVEKVKAEKGIKITKETPSEAVKVDNPTPKIKEAFWKSTELECSFKDVKSLLYFTMRYGPSSVEILEPKSVETKMSELQEFVNELSRFMHRFASQGAGGIVMTPK